MMTLTKQNIEKYAARYDAGEPRIDRIVEEELKAVLKTQTYLTRTQFLKLCMWKSPRPKKHYEKNEEEAIREITEFSLSAKTERARVGVLFALTGVSFPVASVFLHFAFPERYSILDFRALWSLGWDKPAYYKRDFFERYCARVRQIASECNVTVRTVDKALWQYSADHQKSQAATAS